MLDSNPNVGLVYGWIEEINDASGARRAPRNIQNTHRGRAAFEAALTGVSDTASMAYPCIRASIIRQVGGYDERVATNGEEAVFMASVTQICDAEYVPRIIGRLHVNHTHDRLSQTDTPEKFDRYLEIFLLRFGNELRRRPKTLASFYAASAAGLMRVRANTPRNYLHTQDVSGLDPFNRVSNFARLIYVGKGVHLARHSTKKVQSVQPGTSARFIFSRVGE